MPDLREMGLMVKRLQIRHHREGNRALADLDVSIVQWDTLRHMHENPDASLHDLAQLTFQTDQAFGALASRMEARGLVQRVPGPGRAVRHRLTPEGERLRNAGAERFEAVLHESFGALTPPQQETLHGLLRRLMAP